MIVTLLFFKRNYISVILKKSLDNFKNPRLSIFFSYGIVVEYQKGLKRK